MQILEKIGISFTVFLLLYAFISIGSRMLELTTVYLSHMYGGIIATVVGVVLLMYLLLKRDNENN